MIKQVKVRHYDEDDRATHHMMYYNNQIWCNVASFIFVLIFCAAFIHVRHFDEQWYEMTFQWYRFDKV